MILNTSDIRTYASNCPHATTAAINIDFMVTLLVDKDKMIDELS